MQTPRARVTLLHAPRIRPARTVGRYAWRRRPRGEGARRRRACAHSTPRSALRAHGRSAESLSRATRSPGQSACPCRSAPLARGPLTALGHSAPSLGRGSGTRPFWAVNARAPLSSSGAPAARNPPPTAGDPSARASEIARAPDEVRSAARVARCAWGVVRAHRHRAPARARSLGAPGRRAHAQFSLSDH